MTRSIAEHAAGQARNDVTFRVLLVLGAAGLLIVRGLGVHWARLAPWGLAACIGLDLGSVSLPIVGGATGTPRDLAAPPPPPLARIAAGDSLHRVLPINLALSLTNAWISWRVPAVAGLHGAVPVSWAELARHRLFAHPQVLRAFAVQYLGGETPSPPAPEEFERVVENGRELPVWRLKVPSLPRAYAASQVVSAPNDELALEWLGSPQFVPERVVIVSGGGATEGDYPGSAGCAIRWLRDSPDAITIEVEARERAFLVVADHFFPGWKAELDGRSATLHRANYRMRGVAVPSGRHTVRMIYRPEGWQLAVSLTRLGLWLWGVCALGIAGWAARAWFTRRAPSLASHGHALV